MKNRWYKRKKRRGRKNNRTIKIKENGSGKGKLIKGNRCEKKHEKEKE